MSTISVKEYRVHNLQKEYVRYSHVIYDLQKHVVECYDENIISMGDMNFYLKTINDQIKQMINCFNDCMSEMDGDSGNDESKTEFLSSHFPVDLSDFDVELSDEFDHVVNVCRLTNNGQSELNTEVFKNPFETVNEALLKLGEKVGFPNISAGLQLLINPVFMDAYSNEEKELIRMYDRTFVPIKYRIETDDESRLHVKKINSTVQSLIDNMGELRVPKFGEANKSICFVGYFKHDSLNLFVRTSQICHSIVYQKKRSIEAVLANTADINEKFRKTYLKHTGVADILGLTEEQFVGKVERDYAKYRRLSGYSFMNLMKEFGKDNIQNTFDIIKLLLMGSEDNINVAGLMYGLTKDRKVGSDVVANIIYKNLSHASQIKLRKSGANIKAELDKLKALSIEDVDIKKQIALCKHMPDDVRRACRDRAEEMKASNNDYYKQQLFVRTLLNFPWPSKDDDTFFNDIGANKGKSREFLDNIVDRLDKRVYGHKVCKEKIRELMAKWIKMPDSSGSIIGLVGPPGVGKTLIAKGLGDAMGIPFAQITLGGQNDGEYLVGHGYTYSSAQPGLIIKRMVEAGAPRCIMYFDELDKTGKKHGKDEIQDLLIHLTDKNTHNEFTDRFFGEVKFPLHKVLFVFSYNDPGLVDNTLLNRIEQIQVEPYSIQDKVNISRDYMTKEISNSIGFPIGSVNFPDDTYEYLADEFTREPGVRELKRKIESIYLKMNVDRIYDKGPFKDRGDVSVEEPIVVTKKLVDNYLDKPKSHDDEIPEIDTVGHVNGLYATAIGKGGLVPIQIYINRTESDHRFRLHLTGNQGKVMKESVQTALTASMNYLKPSLVKKFLKENPHGFHIHTPSGAVPKDGPSAGAAFATAFISRMLNLPIRNKVAMTGEIELHCDVTAIGGLVYKLTGAKKAGVTKVLVSEKNGDDVKDIKKKHPELFEGEFEVVLVKRLRDVLLHALVGFKEEFLHPSVLEYIQKTEAKDGDKNDSKSTASSDDEVIIDVGA